MFTCYSAPSLYHVCEYFNCDIAHQFNFFCRGSVYKWPCVHVPITHMTINRIIQLIFTVSFMILLSALFLAIHILIMLCSSEAYSIKEHLSASKSLQAIIDASTSLLLPFPANSINSRQPAPDALSLLDLTMV